MFCVSLKPEEKLRDATLIFLVKRTDGKISDICLAMKKRGFGVGRFNGVGGKVEKGEEIIVAAKREAKEEIGVEIKNLSKVAELSFYFPCNPGWNQKVHTYFSEDWSGELIESEEMKPEWFSVKSVPFDKMWPDDIFWLPEVLNDKKLVAEFTFGEGDKVQDQHIQIVDSLV
jgi:8-oxo-dGTP pyrophosphatase MutT (NUDIX family)